MTKAKQPEAEPSTSASILRKLVRNFPENGPKLLLENPANVRDLLVLLREPAVDAIDFSAMTVERTHFVKPDYAHVALDLLLKAPFRAGDTAESILICVMIEHQSKPQRFFQLRLAEYVLEAYKMQKRAWDEQHDSDADFFLHPVLPLVLYTGERSWDKIAALADLVREGDRFRDLIPRFAPHFFNLRDTPAATLEEQGGFFGQILRLIQQQRTERASFRQTLQEVVARFKELTIKERVRKFEFLSYTHALVYHARSEPEQDELHGLVSRSVENDPDRKEYDDMSRTMAEVLLDKGRQEGREEGEIHGLLKKGREVLLRLLRKRFKRVPRAVATRIADTTDVRELDRWIDNAVDAATLADVGIG